MSEKKVVFFVINSLYGGGAEHVAARLSKVLSEKYELYVISLQGISEKDYDFAGSIISVEDHFHGPTWFHKIRRAAKSIDTLALQYKPDVIVSFLQNSNLVVLKTKWKAKKIVSVRNYLPRLHKGLKLKLWNLLIKHYYPKADYVVSVSELLNHEMQTTYGLDSAKCKCIYNPYEIHTIEELSKEPLPIEHQEFYKEHDVIANVGSLATAKGQFHLIRMLPSLRENFPNIGVVLVGPDKGLLEKLQSLATELNVEKHVLFAGFTKNPYKYLPKSKIYVFPSLFEGFPNALAEAMICRMPVVSADCKSGPREILLAKGREYGFLVSDDTTEWLPAEAPLSKSEIEYIDNIANLMRSEELRAKYSSLSYERALDFSINKISENWFKLIGNE